MADLIDRDALIAEYDRVHVGAPGGARKLMQDAPAVNRWISLEYALPEKDKSYITYSETTKYYNHNELPEDTRINILYFNGEEWYDEEIRYYNVTHYMPLPEPPEKE